MIRLINTAKFDRWMLQHYSLPVGWTIFILAVIAYFVWIHYTVKGTPQERWWTLLFKW